MLYYLRSYYLYKYIREIDGTLCSLMYLELIYIYMYVYIYIYIYI